LVKNIYFDLDGISQNVEHIEVIRYACEVLVGKFEGRCYLIEVDTDERTIMTFIAEKSVEMWSGFN
jgi:hypothetical protein